MGTSSSFKKTEQPIYIYRMTILWNCMEKIWSGKIWSGKIWYVICLPGAKIWLMEEILNNHLECIKSVNHGDIYPWSAAELLYEIPAFPGLLGSHTPERHLDFSFQEGLPWRSIILPPRQSTKQVMHVMCNLWYKHIHIHTRDVYCILYKSV